MSNLPERVTGSVLQDGAEPNKLFLEKRGDFSDFKLKADQF